MPKGNLGELKIYTRSRAAASRCCCARILVARRPWNAAWCAFSLNTSNDRFRLKRVPPQRQASKGRITGPSCQDASRFWLSWRGSLPCRGFRIGETDMQARPSKRQDMVDTLPRGKAPGSRTLTADKGVGDGPPSERFNKLVFERYSATTSGTGHQACMPIFIAKIAMSLRHWREMFGQDKHCRVFRKHKTRGLLGSFGQRARSKCDLDFFWGAPMTTSPAAAALQWNRQTLAEASRKQWFYSQHQAYDFRGRKRRADSVRSLVRHRHPEPTDQVKYSQGVP